MERPIGFAPVYRHLPALPHTTGGRGGEPVSEPPRSKSLPALVPPGKSLGGTVRLGQERGSLAAAWGRQLPEALGWHPETRALVEAAKGHLAPIDASLKAREADRLEEALKQQGGKTFLDAIAKTRRQRSVPHLHRQAFESALASHMVKARTELGRWQAGSKELKQALDSRDRVQLQSVLRRWTANASSTRHPEVEAASQQLRHWEQVASEMAPLLQTALATKDLSKIRKVVQDIDARDGPMDVPGATEARALLDKYASKTKRLRQAITQHNAQLVEAALGVWDGSPEDELYLAGRRMLALRGEQLEALRSASTRVPLVPAELERALSNWQFETRHEDVMAANDLYKTYIKQDKALRKAASVAPTGLLRLRQLLEGWPFEADLRSNTGYTAAIEAFHNYFLGLRAAVEAADGFQARCLWQAFGSGPDVLQTAPFLEAAGEELGGPVDQASLDKLKQAAEDLIQRHSTSEIRLLSALVEGSDLRTSATQHIQQLVQEWVYSSDDPAIAAARAWLRLQSLAGSRSSRDLQAACETQCAKVIKGSLSRCQGLSEESPEFVQAHTQLEECDLLRQDAWQSIVSTDPDAPMDEEGQSIDEHGFQMVWLEAPVFAASWAASSGSSSSSSSAAPGGEREEDTTEHRIDALRRGLQTLKTHLSSMERAREAVRREICNLVLGPANDVSEPNFEDYKSAAAAAAPSNGDLEVAEEDDFGEQEAEDQNVTHSVELIVSSEAGEVLVRQAFALSSHGHVLMKAVAGRLGANPNSIKLIVEGPDKREIEEQATLASQGLSDEVSSLVVVEAPPPLLRRFEACRSALQAVMASKDPVPSALEEVALQPFEALRITQGAVSMVAVVDFLDNICRELRIAAGPQALTKKSLTVSEVMHVESNPTQAVNVGGSIIPIVSVARANSLAELAPKCTLSGVGKDILALLHAYFESFVPLRTALAAAEAAVEAASEALENAQSAVEGLPGLRPARRAPPPTRNMSQVGSSNCLFELLFRRKQEGAVREIQQHCQEECRPTKSSSFEEKLRWVKQLLETKLRPFRTTALETLPGRAEEIRHNDISSFIHAGNQTHSQIHSSPTAAAATVGFAGLASGLAWLLHGKSSKDLSDWEAVSIPFADNGAPLSTKKLKRFNLTAMSSRGLTHRCQQARRSLTIAVPWFAQGCSSCGAARRLFAWAATVVICAPQLPRVLALQPLLNSVTKGLNIVEQMLGIPRDIWDSVKEEIEAESDVDPLWWLRLCDLPAPVALEVCEALELSTVPKEKPTDNPRNESTDEARTQQKAAEKPQIASVAEEREKRDLYEEAGEEGEEGEEEQQQQHQQQQQQQQQQEQQEHQQQQGGEDNQHAPLRQHLLADEQTQQQQQQEEQQQQQQQQQLQEQQQQQQQQHDMQPEQQQKDLTEDEYESDSDENTARRASDLAHVAVAGAGSDRGADDDDFEEEDKESGAQVDFEDDDDFEDDEDEFED